MGFNSLIYISNDAMGAIDEDPSGWWTKTKHELQLKFIHGNLREKYGFKNFANYFQAVWNEHADTIGIIAVGGNYTTVLHRTSGRSHHTNEDRLRIVTEMANDLGYSLVKNEGKSS